MKSYEMNAYRDYPIDKIVEIEVEHFIRVLKFLPYNEQIFSEHFINNPVYPGSMILNSSLAALDILFRKKSDSKGYRICGIKKVAYRKPCKPGDVLDIQVHLKNERMAEFLVKSYFEQIVVSNGIIEYLR